MTLSETARFWAENPDIAVEAFLILVFPALLLLAMTIHLGRLDGKLLKRHRGTAPEAGRDRQPIQE